VDRVLTIPNGISAARLAGVPVFLWLVLGPRTATADYWAVGLLIAAGLSDWLDGKIARAFNQASRLGQLLDPAADRLYIVATLVALAVRQIIPWWLVAVLAVRELTVGVALALLKRQAGYGTLQVSLVGKAATLCLLYAFPLLFLGDHPGWGGTLARVIGWAFATWGTVLYWWAAMLYLAQVRTLVSRSARPEVGVAGPLASGPARGHTLGRKLGKEPQTGEGRRNGRGRRHTVAANDRQPAQAAAAGS
jgi:cardiolipin synthase